MGDLPYDVLLGEYLRRPYSTSPRSAPHDALSVRHRLNTFTRSIGDLPVALPARDYMYNRYRYYPNPTIPPGFISLPSNSNIHGTISIDDNRFWPYGWPNPSVLHPNPRPRFGLQPAPYPGRNIHCQGTCGHCGQVGCGATLSCICDLLRLYCSSHNQGHENGCAQQRCTRQGCVHHGCTNHACSCRNDNHHTCGHGNGRLQQSPLIVEPHCCRCTERREAAAYPRREIRDRDRYRDWDREERIRGEYVRDRFRPDSPQPPYHHHGPGPWQDGRWRWVPD